MYIFIDLDHWPQTAATDAAHGFQRKALVGSRFTIADAKLFMYPFMHPFRTAHVTGRTQADRDDISTPRLQAEGAVKRCNTKDPALWNANLDGQII